KLSIFLVFMVGIVFFVAGARAEDFQARSREVVTQLAAREFDKVEARFDATMSSLSPVAKLAETWHAILARAGSFKSITGTRQQASQKYEVVFVTTEFERAILDLKLVWDSQGHIAGFFIAPGQSGQERPAPKPAKPSDIDGDWYGSLDLGALKLRIVFHVTNTEDGLTATMDSPDENLNGVRATTVTRNGESLKIELKRIGGVFEGKISQDVTTIAGNYSPQTGGTLPLLLKRAKNAAELERRRPQDPKKPYPYSEEQVTYQNKSAGVTLAGTLTLPPGKGPFPAVLLIAGSGPNDRDESLMGHRPFLVLSDYLTRKGIAVLRADKRGVAKSGGDYLTATTADFASDAEAGVAYLKSRPEIAPRKIGLIGHSEGGSIVPMIAARNPDVAFIVMMAGTGVSGLEILVEQSITVSEGSGASHERALQNSAKERELLTLVTQERDEAVLEKKLREKLSADVPPGQLDGAIKQITSPWVRFMLVYDPATELRKVKCPLLVLNGSKDIQVVASQNLPPIREALEASGNKDFEIDELPGLNHLFQTAKTGQPSEYPDIEETISPAVLEKITSWILQRSGRVTSIAGAR
ncbi:MAG TPA: alpha/beta fold hydrolase, partial [Candidatus Angelobacter sp.]|nr:alpha/beta fold hydrolase [Candidatus Angelobacter sp.]